MEKMAQISFDSCLRLIDECVKSGVLKAGSSADSIVVFDAERGKWQERQTLDFALELMSEREKKNELMTLFFETTGKKFK